MLDFKQFLGEGYEDDKKKVVGEINHILNDPHLSDQHGKFYVFRMGNGGALDNRNAGDILGIAKFSSSDNAEVSATGHAVGMYEVTNKTPGHFGPYTLYRAQSKISGDQHMQIGRQSVPIKWGINRDHAYWYSFPQYGEWSARLVHEVSVSALNQKAKSLGFKYFSENETSDVIIIHSVFF